jgi:hypothetical protein
MKEHKGVMVMVEDPAQADQITAWDACPWGLGRVSSSSWYGIPMPECLQGLPIHAQEMINMTADLTFQVDVEGLKNSRYIVLLDNQPSVIVMSPSGSPNCPLLRKCIRQLFKICVKANLFLHAIHYPDEDNRLADSASRLFHPDAGKRLKAQKIVDAEVNVHRTDQSEIVIKTHYFDMSSWK